MWNTARWMLCILPLTIGCLRTESGDWAQVAAEMKQSLRSDLIDLWYPRAVDSLHGGYLSSFDYRWEPVGAQEKMIVTQARHVWTASYAATFFDDATYLPVAAHGFAFLRDAMWDSTFGGFFNLVSREGVVQPEQDGRIIKQAYGNAFAIYALAAYAAVSGDENALHLARDAFRWLDANAHDPVHGGYFQFLERDGSPIREGWGGTPPKDQNSSIHLMEAFTELYRIWPDPVLRERLAEMLRLIRDEMTTDRGYLDLHFTADWTPVSYRDSSEAVRRAREHLDHVSFGHDVETAFLLYDAAELLGEEVDLTLAKGKQMVDHALRYGWEEGVGGLYDRGYYFSDTSAVEILAPTKTWWAQAEALNTLSMMHEHFPSDSMGYGDRFFLQWEYVKANLIDSEHGGWFESGIDRAPDGRMWRKGHIWKGAYHETRSLMAVTRRVSNGR